MKTHSLAREEWRLNWALVLSAMAGKSFAAVPSLTLGLFMAPLESEFGWSRTQISAGLTVFAIVSLPLTPFAGVLVDKFGARSIAVPGVLLSALAFAGFGLLSGSLVQWFAIWTAVTVTSVMIRNLVWSTAISGAFAANRGLAIALVLCGAAAAQSVAPILSRWFVDDFGWRAAYVALAASWGGIAFLLCLLFFRVRVSPGSDSAHRADGSLRAAGGLTVKQAVRSFRMHRIAIACFLQNCVVIALSVHLFPLLTETGLSRAEAASLAALLGLGTAAGKLLTGWLSDRVTSTLLPVATFFAPALAYLLLWQGAGSTWALAAAVIVLGYSGGASLQLTIYLTSRYAGLRNFGTIFGLISTLLALAAGVGPLLAGAIFDAYASYTPLLVAGIFAALFSGLLVFKLGTYPEFAPCPTSPEADERSGAS